MKTQVKQKRVSLPVVKLGASRQIVIPKKIYDALGLLAGSYFEVQIHKFHQLLITPKELVDRHPEIDQRLAEAEEDVKAGRVSGPFKTVAEFTRYLHALK